MKALFMTIAYLWTIAQNCENGGNPALEREPDARSFAGRK